MLRLAAVSVFVAVVLGTQVLGTSGQRSVQRTLDGERLFQGYCAPCHGHDGKGRGPTAATLKAVPADLTVLATKNAGTFPRERVIRLIATGEPAAAAHGSKEMPIWGPVFGSLTPPSFEPVNPKIDDVVRYLESIQGR